MKEEPRGPTCKAGRMKLHGVLAVLLLFYLFRKMACKMEKRKKRRKMKRDEENKGSWQQLHDRL